MRQPHAYTTRIAWRDTATTARAVGHQLLGEFWLRGARLALAALPEASKGSKS